MGDNTRYDCRHLKRHGSFRIGYIEYLNSADLKYFLLFAAYIYNLSLFEFATFIYDFNNTQQETICRDQTFQMTSFPQDSRFLCNLDLLEI